MPKAPPTVDHPDPELVWVLTPRTELDKPAEAPAPPKGKYEYWPWRTEQCNGSVALFHGDRLVCVMESRAFDAAADVGDVAARMVHTLNVWYDAQQGPDVLQGSGASQ